MSVGRVRALILGVGLGCGLLAAAPAWAHVKVDAHPERPGATDAQLTFTAKSESKTAGITKLEILATPSVPGEVTLVGGPAGWKVSPGSFGGFAVEGAALPAGHDAKVTVEVKQLPMASQIVFKVLQSYSDGRIDRWTDPTGPDGKEPEHPASVLKLSAGAPDTAVKGAQEAKPPADVKGARETKPAEVKGAQEAKPAEGTRGALARTGSGSRSLALLAGLLFLVGGSSIVAGSGRRRWPLDVGRQGIEP